MNKYGIIAVDKIWNVLYLCNLIKYLISVRMCPSSIYVTSLETNLHRHGLSFEMFKVKEKKCVYIL